MSFKSYVKTKAKQGYAVAKANVKKKMEQQAKEREIYEKAFQKEYSKQRENTLIKTAKEAARKKANPPKQEYTNYFEGIYKGYK